MKKAKTFLIFILGLVLGALASVGVYLYTQGDVEWAVYLEEKLIPNAVLALTTVGALCGAAMPIISRVNATLVSFDGATSDVKNTVASDKKMISEIKGYREELTALTDEMRVAIEEVRAVKGEIAEQIAPVETTAKNIEEIVHIGFGNNEELVRGGFAAAIAKVGADNGKERKEG